MLKNLVYTITLFILYFGLLIGCTGTSGVVDRTSGENDDLSEDDDQYYEDVYLQYEDHVYRPNIKTAIIHKKGWELSPPLFKLTPGEGVSLKFDDLDGDVKDYSYTVIHCTSDWQPSDLTDSEYLTGYYSDLIRDYKYSFGTLVPFTQYRLDLPNEDMQITKTGNYIVTIYLNNDPEQLVLTKRFMVFEDLVTVTPRVKRPTVVENRDIKQEVDFVLNHSRLAIPNPYGDLKVVMRQNLRWDNAVQDLKPIFVKDQELIYDLDDDNVFDGENEFRWFDIKTLRFQTERIRRIAYDSSAYDVYVIDDVSRKWAQYMTMPDINGRYIIRTQQGFDHDLESEYVTVHFKLPFEQSLINGNVYLFGSMTDWQFNKDFQMIYNSKSAAYEASILLKQGYYNYSYAFLKDNAQSGDLTFFEGNHFETENDYSIYVYYRDITGNYDRLVGAHHFNSRRN